MIYRAHMDRQSEAISDHHWSIHSRSSGSLGLVFDVLPVAHGWTGLCVVARPQRWWSRRSHPRAISSLSAATAPLQYADADAFTKLGRANLFFALVGTVSFALLTNDPFSMSPACQIAALCRTYPVGWLSLAGMHYCYSIVAYIIARRSP